MTRISNKDLNEAGQILKAGYNEEAFDKIDGWRRLHTHVINRFKLSLNRCINENKGINKDYIVAQRLKRMPTILNKIASERYKGTLSDMQDIGGLRIILKNIDEVKYLASIFANKKTKQILKKQYDYITKPKDTGYRGIHLVYKTVYPKPEYKDLQIEIQFRTELQHIWATAVETVDTILNKSLKFEKKDPEWLEFFALVSSAFALQEKQPVLEAHKNLSFEEIKNKITIIEKKMNIMVILDTILTVDMFVMQDSNISFSKNEHIVLAINISRKVFYWNSYKNEKSAEKKYGEIEKQTLQGELIQAVLIKLNNFKKLKKAYPNYFLDTTDFVKELKKILEIL
jgi:putative GTP pyrophosphokinase